MTLRVSLFNLGQLAQASSKDLKNKSGEVVRKYLSASWPLRFLMRLSVVAPYFRPRLALALAWVGRRTENSNFYYDLTEKNFLELAQFISVVFNIELSQAESFITEVRTDKELNSHLIATLGRQKSMRDSTMFLGRRVGWYAAVRAMKPKLVVETGVSQGVGSVTIITALRRNLNEGYPGRYLGTDIDAQAGVLLNEEFLELGKLLIGDSIASLEGIEDKVDILINDSDHSEQYEAREYEVIQSKLGKGSIILGDNSHATDVLLRFSISNQRKFLFFKEEPKDHWYPGGGIGFSYK